MVNMLYYCIAQLQMWGRMDGTIQGRAFLASEPKEFDVGEYACQSITISSTTFPCQRPVKQVCDDFFYMWFRVAVKLNQLAIWLDPLQCLSIFRPKTFRRRLWIWLEGHRYLRSSHYTTIYPLLMPHAFRTTNDSTASFTSWSTTEPEPCSLFIII